MNGSVNEEPSSVASPQVKLSVVIDGRLGWARARQVATLADRLGLAGVWLRQPWWPSTAPAVSETDWVGLLVSDLQIPLGVIVDADEADIGLLNHLGSVPPGLRIVLTGTPAAVARWQQLIGPSVSQLALPIPDVLPAPGVAASSARGAAASSACDVAVSSARSVAVHHAVFVPCTPGRDLAGEVSAAVAAAAGRPVLAEVTVSVGRTAAEARARADTDELFNRVGHPAQQGLFGTLEECQATAAQLAHAGVTELVCYLPLASDLPDVLAQVRSIAIGAGVLRPGEPPSAPPPPPLGWGGRRITR